MSRSSLEVFPKILLKLCGFSSHFTKTRSGSIHHYEKRVKDEKGVCVFLHGIGSSGAHFGRVLIPLQKQGYSMFAPDLPGHGFSPDSSDQLSPDSLFETFVEWVDQVVPGKFNLVGNSMGGGLSLRYALTYPERVNRLVMASPAGGFETEEEWADFKKLIYFESLEDVRSFMDRIFHRNPFYLPLLYRTVYQSFQRKGVRELLEVSRLKDVQLVSDAALEQALERFPPALLIWGKSERLFPAKNLSWFKKVLPPNVLIEEPQNIGHCPHLDDPKWFHGRIHEFVK